jgi:hypothetical protein
MVTRHPITQRDRPGRHERASHARLEPRGRTTYRYNGCADIGPLTFGAVLAAGAAARRRRR